MKDNMKTYTAKSLGLERSKSLALSVVSNFRSFLRVGSPRNFTRAHVFFSPAPQIAITKIRDYSQSRAMDANCNSPVECEGLMQVWLYLHNSTKQDKCKQFLLIVNWKPLFNAISHQHFQEKEFILLQLNKIYSR